MARVTARQVAPESSYTPLNWSELDLIRKSLTGDGPAEAVKKILLERIQQQLDRSEILAKSLTKMGSSPLVQLFVVGGHCIFCHKKMNTVEDVKIHVSRKHFSEVAIEGEAEAQKQTRSSRSSMLSSWEAPRKINLNFWRSEEFAEGWELDQESEWQADLRMEEYGTIFNAGNGHPFQLNTGQYVGWRPHDGIWEIDGNYYDQLLILVQM